MYMARDPIFYEPLMYPTADNHVDARAFDREEHSLGISAVSVAIRSPAGELAAISLPAPTQRFEAHEAELTKALLKHSAGLQRSLTR